MENKKHRVFDLTYMGDGRSWRWKELDRWKWVVIDVGVILHTPASRSENLFSRHF